MALSNHENRAFTIHTPHEKNKKEYTDSPTLLLWDKPMGFTLQSNNW
jgi:hypothetical protein